MKAFLSVLAVIVLVFIGHKVWAQAVGAVTTDAQCQTASVVEVGNVVVNDTAAGYNQVLTTAENDLNQKSQTIQAIEVGISQDQVQIATANMALTAFANCSPTSQPIYGNGT